MIRVPTIAISLVFTLCLLGCSAESATETAVKEESGLFPESELAERYGRQMVETANKPCTGPESAFADKKITFESENGSIVHVFVKNGQVVKESFIRADGLSPEVVAEIRSMNAGKSMWKIGFEHQDPVWKRKDGKALMWPYRFGLPGQSSYIVQVIVITPNAAKAVLTSGKGLSIGKEQEAWLTNNISTLHLPE